MDYECCPECGNNKLEVTCAGSIIEDTNKATCECGWTGQKTDLTKDNMSAKVLRENYKKKLEDEDKLNPKNWSNEQLADYFLWTLTGKSFRDVEEIVNIFLEKLKG